jgi:predicted DNA-binding antitoxin AbrB/MazE fold protein
VGRIVCEEARMMRRVEVVFDDGVLRPVEPLDLKQDQHYVVILLDLKQDQHHVVIPEEEPTDGGVLDDIVELAQDLDLPADFAAQHDHYLYGTPKR